MNKFILAILVLVAITAVSAQDYEREEEVSRDYEAAEADEDLGGDEEDGSLSARSVEDEDDGSIVKRKAGGSPSNADRQLGLKAHNKYRAQHKNTGPLTLDNALNAKAQKCAQHYAAKKTIDHSCPGRNKKTTGENLYMSSHKVSMGKQIENGVKSWYDEIKLYNYKNPGYKIKTGHFTQLVWKASKKVGIGAYTDPKSGKTYVVALYSPLGNFGQANDYAKNVAPKK